MVVDTADKKKRLEARYLEEARGASALFPSGTLTPQERPDFLLATPNGTIGIEITELCRAEPRAEKARLARVPAKARSLYNARVGVAPVDVSPALSERAATLPVDMLARRLADFVDAHHAQKGSFEGALPDGFCHIGIFEPLDPESGGRWLYFSAFDTVVAPRTLIEERVAEKNRRLPEYRAAAAEVWLLIVNDLSLGAGEVYARVEDLASWRFAFDFDRVMLFSRQPGGSGVVIPLLRA